MRSETEKTEKSISGRYDVLIESWNSFNTLKGNKYKLNEKALVKLVNYYFVHVNEKIRPHLKKSAQNRINVFKICSATELAIMSFQPVDIKNKKSRRLVNSEFAFYTSLYILILRFDIKPNQLKPFLLKEEVKYFITEHRKFLQKVNFSTNNPIFSNAETWQLLYYLICTSTSIPVEIYRHGQ